MGIFVTKEKEQPEKIERFSPRVEKKHRFVSTNQKALGKGGHHLAPFDPSTTLIYLMKRTHITPRKVGAHTNMLLDSHHMTNHEIGLKGLVCKQCLRYKPLLEGSGG